MCHDKNCFNILSPYTTWYKQTTGFYRESKRNTRATNPRGSNEEDSDNGEEEDGSDEDTMCAGLFYRAIYDEAHKLKSTQLRTSKSASYLKSRDIEKQSRVLLKRAAKGVFKIERTDAI